MNTHQNFLSFRLSILNVCVGVAIFLTLFVAWRHALLMNEIRYMAAAASLSGADAEECPIYLPESR